VAVPQLTSFQNLSESRRSLPLLQSVNTVIIIVVIVMFISNTKIHSNGNRDNETREEHYEHAQENTAQN